MTIAVVTDSTAYLPSDVAGGRGIVVIALAVHVTGRDGREGVDVTPADVALALEERRVAVTTSRPTPEEFGAAYRRLLDAGAEGVLSVHLSGRLSGTVDSARLAAAELGDRVTVVDSGSAAMGVGFAAIEAASAAGAGQDLAGVRACVESAAERTTALFYVDTLEFLRRGGRIGAASALVGTALSVKPILGMAAGEVRIRERVRTAGRALSRLVDLAVEAADESDVDVAVHHFAAASRAEELSTALRERLAGRIRSAYLSEVGAAMAAHVGPGFAGIVIHRAAPVGA